MLLSNRWGKSEGDHIVLQSLKINYVCSFCLLSPILFLPLLCLFLGWGQEAQPCNPDLPSPFSRSHSGDAELWLRLLQPSEHWAGAAHNSCWSLGRGARAGWEGREGSQTEEFLWMALPKHTRVSLFAPLTTNFSHLLLQWFDFMCLFHTFKEHGVAFLF